jgi:hypothetical protein
VAQSLNDKFNNINMKKREIEKKSDNVKKKTCEKGDVEQYINHMLPRWDQNWQERGLEVRL